MNREASTHYCEIIVRGPAPQGTQFFRGQGSSYRVAAQRAIAKLAYYAGTFENVTIKTGKVG